MNRISRILAFASLTIGIAVGQVATPTAGLRNLGLIPVPNWATSGPNQEATDLSSFNPATSILYYADRVNHAVLAIDTKIQSVVGMVQVPNCTGSCPSGVLVVPDLQKLVVTDRATTTYIYDLDLPGSQPAAVKVPTAIDELDYDPIHQRVYIGNTTAPFFLTGIDLTGDKANTVVASIPIPGSAEQPRFNPNDGYIYLTIPSVGVLVFNPTAGTAGTGDLVATYPISNCSGNGNWIDPVTNTMLVGCNNVAGLALINLADGSILARFPQVNTDDVIAFNSSNRRWYTGSGGNGNDTGKCAATNAGNVFPALGVFQAQSATSAGKGTIVGAECSGRSGTNLAVDPIHNNIYIPVRQYPVDPSSADTGRPGILVFNDPTPGQATPARSQASLGTYGTVNFTLQSRTMNVQIYVQKVMDAPTELVITTTVGNEVIPCAETGGNANCIGSLTGDPLLGGVVLLGNGGSILAKGTIVQSR